jgi:hypothetical protein
MTVYLALAALAVAKADTRAFRASEPVPIRALVIDADLAVLAQPADPPAPVRFRVLKVLRGRGVKVGDVLAPRGFEARHVRTWVPPMPPETKPAARRIDQALLFLRKAGAGGWEVLPGGLRFWGNDGVVFQAVPPPRDSRAPFLLKEMAEVNWSVLAW